MSDFTRSPAIDEHKWHSEIERLTRERDAAIQRAEQAERQRDAAVKALTAACASRSDGKLRVSDMAVELIKHDGRLVLWRDEARRENVYEYVLADAGGGKATNPEPTAQGPKP